MKILPLFLFALLLSCSLCLAEKESEEAGAADKGASDKKEEAKEKPKEETEEKVSVTTHTGTFGGEEIEYTATAGTMVISKKEKDPKASVFYVAYTKDGIKNPAKRPIVYCFNGGPGSSAVWLHLGGFGPKRVQMKKDGTMPNPPFQLAENPDSILSVADLVFIDPVSTGYSRSDDEEKAGEFHGFKGDLDSMAEFIRLYTTRNERWLSPKFLAGESYGAFRAAGLSSVLHKDFGLYLNGVVLVSGVLSFDTLWGTDLADVNFLQAMSEVAAYHGKLDQPLIDDAEGRRAEVEDFAKGDYAAALMKGGRIGEAENEAIATQVSRYTGIDVEAVKKHRLRIPSSYFREEILKDEGLMIGRFDARVTGRDGSLAGTSPGFDPSYAAVYGPFSATLNDYLRRELEFESDLIYEILSRRVHPWKYGDDFVGEAVTVTPQLAAALSENPALKVMVNCGYQDLATPYAAIRHSLDHLDLDPSLLDNIEYTFYEGGHMMYTIEESNTQWNKDVAEFIERCSGGE
tara:strand:+ start:4247 stop:5797 length:1551 start_codon:yes stop_codon:yes gene_type:complete